MSDEYNKKKKSGIKQKFIRFWRADNGKMSLVRDVVIALLLVLILLTALWAYTGQWWGAPMVAIESGSMEHPNPPFGRYGTIDAGDMVLIVKVNTKNDVVPRGSSIHGTMERKDKENYFYGDYGDVIVYHPYGNKNADQIIHRAICWVEVNKDGIYTTYNVTDYSIFNQPSITIPELGLNDYKPTHSGFITKGDNNKVCDQTSSDLCSEPIKVGWISGKARSEIPWIGTINLFFNDLTSGKNTVKNVHSDSIECLILLIAILISIPIILDAYDYYKNKKKNPPIEDYTEHETYPNNKIDPSSEEIEKHIDENF
jgi:signal peptidase I